MKNRMMCGLVFVVAVAAAAWAADKIQPLNVKPGLWETTMTLTIAGQPPIPPDVLSKLTPEQRARFEARMNAQSGGAPTTSTYKSCWTKQKINDVSEFNNKKKNCKLTVLTSTPTKASGKIDCADQGMTYGGKAEFETSGPESVKGSGHMTASGYGRTMNVNSTYTSKWIGSECGDVQ